MQLKRISGRFILGLNDVRRAVRVERDRAVHARHISGDPKRRQFIEQRVAGPAKVVERAGHRDGVLWRGRLDERQSRKAYIAAVLGQLAHCAHQIAAVAV